MTEITVIENSDTLVVDSRLVARELGIGHRNFVETIRTYENDIQQSFGILRFETSKLSGVGRPESYYWLTEDQATFLMTLSRNTPEAVQCKLNLVKAFSHAKELLKRRDQVQDTRIPYWYQRTKLALSDSNKPLPSDCFCVYLRMMDFFSQLEVRLHYIVPDISPQTGRRLIPDISISKKFNDFLRSDEEMPCRARLEFLGSTETVDFRPSGSHYGEIQFYNHVYPEISHGSSNIQQCNAYPVKYASIFDYYLQEYWIPDRCIGYLQERDSEGVEYIRHAVSQLPPGNRDALMTTLVGRLIRSLPPSS